MLEEIFGGSNKIIKCDCSINYSTEQTSKVCKNDLFVNVVSRIKSVKPVIWMKEGSDNEEVAAPTYYISNKNACYLASLQTLGIKNNKTE